MKLNVDFSELENAVQQMKNTTIDCSKSNNTVDSLQYYKPLQCEPTQFCFNLKIHPMVTQTRHR